MRTIGMWMVALVVFVGISEADTTLQFNYPTREAGKGRCDDSTCVSTVMDSVLVGWMWVPIERCTQMQLTALVDRDDLWWLNLWINNRGQGAQLKRRRRIASNMAGMTDTVNVATEDAMESVVWVTVQDSSGNASCPSNLVTLFNGSPDTRVGVGTGSSPPGLATMHRAPYRAPRGTILYDLSGRKISAATTTGLYWLVGPGWTRKVVVVR